MQADGDLDDTFQPAESAGYACPRCGEIFLPETAPTNGLLTCPACGEEFFAVVDTSDEEREIEREREAVEREAELDGVRIRQLAALRRAMGRTLTYILVAAFGCLGAAAQLVFMIWQFLHGPGASASRLIPIGYGMGAVAAVMGAVAFFRHSRRVRAELAKPALETPAAEPDFSTLDNGSQQWKDLHSLGREAPRRTS